MAIATPATWTQSSMPTQVLKTSTGLAVADEATRGAAALTELTLGDRFIPGDRTGAKYLFSARTNRFLMVGGRRGTQAGGPLTGEIWSYALDTHLWTQLFGDTVYTSNGISSDVAIQLPTDPRISPMDVVAATYSDLKGQMLIIDDATNSTTTPSNGTFETGSLSNWTLSGTTLIHTNSATEGDGWYSAQIGSTGPSTDSYITQTLTIPSSGVSTLSFDYRVVCQDTITYDWFTVTLFDNSTQTTYTPLAKTCTNTGTWSTATYTLPSTVKGHSVTLKFLNHDDNYPGDPTYTYVDNISIPTVQRRFYALDMKAGAATQLQAATRSDLYAYIGLAPQDDGSYTMVKQSNGGGWTACRFTLVTTNGITTPTFSLSWTGSGSLLNQPLNTSQGIVLFTVDTNGNQSLVKLATMSGSSNVSGCSTL